MDTMNSVARLRWETIQNVSVGSESKAGNGCLLDPARCLELVKDPSYQNYHKLRKGLRKGNSTWMGKFLEMDGLVLLLTGLGELSRDVANIEDVVLILECIQCVREVLNSVPGIEFIVRNRREETASQLAKVLAMDNIAVKTQVFELLSALCAYSPEGFRLVSRCLLRYQDRQRKPHLMHVVIDELRVHADDDSKSSYTAVLLAFVNCVLVCAEDSKRDQLLKDLKDCYFYEVFSRIPTNNCEAVRIQINAILETLQNSGTGAGNVPAMVARQSITAMFDHVKDPVQQEKLLEFIKNLDIATKDDENGPKLLQKLRILLLPEEETDFKRSMKDEATSPMILPASDRRQQFSVFSGSESSVESEDGDKIVNGTVDDLNSSDLLPSPQALPVPTVKVLPPAISSTPPPPPPPPPLNQSTHSGPLRPPPPPPPPPATTNGQLQSQSQSLSTSSLPKENLKSVRWNKIFVPVEKLTHSVWSCDSTEMEVSVDTVQNLKKLFSDKDVIRRGSVDSIMMRTPTPTQLLDSKRSLKINICLKKFKELSVKQLIDHIVDVNHSSFTTDDLIGLMSILPTPEEVKLFQDYEGAVDELGHAESFLYWLVRVPDYHLRVEGTLMSKEFPVQASSLMEDFSELEVCCKALLTSHSFKRFLHLSLHVGNILNNGKSIGGATAIKLDGLLKLIETASNEPKMSLLHYVVKEAKSQSKEALDFLEEFEVLQKVNRLKLDDVQSDMNVLLGKFEDLKTRLSTAATSLQEQASVFVTRTTDVVVKLKASRDSLLQQVRNVAEYFVEDIGQFKIEDCLANINTFTTQIQGVLKDLAKKEHDENVAAAQLLTPPVTSRHSRLNGTATLPRSFGRKGPTLGPSLRPADSFPARERQPGQGVIDQLLDVITRRSPDDRYGRY